MAVSLLVYMLLYPKDIETAVVSHHAPTIIHITIDYKQRSRISRYICSEHMAKNMPVPWDYKLLHQLMGLQSLLKEAQRHWCLQSFDGALARRSARTSVSVKGRRVERRRPRIPLLGRTGMR